jgi:L-aminopeptidase/D-esterase-like protein
MQSNNRLTSLFEAATEATEEAVVNAMVAAGDMVGANGVKVSGLPHEEVRKILRKYVRLQDSAAPPSGRR